MYPLTRLDLKNTYALADSEPEGGPPVLDKPGDDFRRDSEAGTLAMITRVLKHFAIKFPTTAEVHYLEDVIQAMPLDLMSQDEVFRHLVIKMTGERLRNLRKRNRQA